MKTRMGFVSNSSSCSFTIVASKDAYSRIYNAMSESGKRLMNEAWGNREGFKIDTTEIVDLSYVDHDCNYWMSVCEDMDKMEAFNAGKEIVEALKNDKGAYVNVKGC